MKKLILLSLILYSFSLFAQNNWTGDYSNARVQANGKNVNATDTVISRYLALKKQTYYPSSPRRNIIINYKDTLKFYNGSSWEVLKPNIDVKLNIADSNLYVTQKALNDTINYKLTGRLTNKGDYNASVNQWPTGTVNNGDWYTISVKGFITPDSLRVGDIITAKIDNPGQTNANWNIIRKENIGVIPQARKAGSKDVGYVKYNGRVAESGYWNGGINTLGNDTINFAGSIRGSSSNSNGIYGYSSVNSGVFGYSVSGNGITGQSETVYGVSGNSTSNFGVLGQSSSSIGVKGISSTNSGVYGISTSGTGVYGFSSSGSAITGIGVAGVGGYFSTSTNKYIATFNKGGYNSDEKASLDTTGKFETTGDLTYSLRHAFLNKTASYTPAISQNVYLKLAPGFTTVEASNMTVGGDTLVNVTAGDYYMIWTFDVSGNANDDFEFQVRKNSVSVQTAIQTTTGTGNYQHTTILWYFHALAAGDKISFYCTNISNNDDPTLRNQSIYIRKEHD